MVLPRSGRCFLSVRERDKPGVVELAKKVLARGFDLVATEGTARVIADAGLPVRVVNKVREGPPDVDFF